jgi:hypothetical protein
MMKMEGLDLSTEERATEEILERNCTLCGKADCLLIRLNDEIQRHSIKKGFESYFCTTTLQVVNFVNGK